MKNKLLILFNKGYLKFLPTNLYLRLKYRLRNGSSINLNNPKTFNEKLNWSKIHDRNDLYTMLADKVRVKQYVEQKIGKEYIIETYCVWQNVSDIDIDILPNEFVLKCNHDSSGAIICKNKADFDLKTAKFRLSKSLKRNFYASNREWPYKNIKPSIIAEKYIKDDTINILKDYKFMCFNGKPEYVYITVKDKVIWENYYDLDFNPVYIDHGFPRYKEEFKRPKNYDKMLDIVKKIAINIPFVRIDMHNVNGKIYFGEFTFYDWGAMLAYRDNWDEELGKLMNLNMVKKNEK